MTNRKLLERLQQLTPKQLDQEILIDSECKCPLCVGDAGLVDLYDQDIVEENRFEIELWHKTKE